ncbi:hypothetical protein HGP28_18155 [Vibrio sp. SM6]|uniref:Uncharacterized protein n=1 Tax=Vibrio agarilyticus TaxID=2726741 RepID=A0A7X8YIJ2_9VIBR|nr:hypothetical protein [Vibrio agarilyticus]NLS14784.1 hypothetical protein [Vibrio agarilyticus]
MNIDKERIETLEELQAFITAVENGSFALNHVAGIALATSNSTGEPFIVVLNDKHQPLKARLVSDFVYQNGKEIVRQGSGGFH